MAAKGTTPSRAVMMGALLLGVALTGAPDHAALAGSAETDSLAAGFENPPMSARPRVWWHWMNGNVTKDGIAKDLDWMSRVGIGGLQTFDVDLMTPQIVPHRLVYMSPEWKDAFRFAAGLADEKGLELAIASSPGWSETGGPWVKPEDAMKKLVWSETILAGGQPFQGVLAQPPKATGPMGDLAEEPSFLGPPDPNKPQIYADAAVVAYRIPDAPAPAPVIALAGGASLEAGAIQDGKLSTGLEIARGDDKAPTTLVFSYPAPVTIRTLVIALSPNNDVFGFGGAQVAPRLEAEDGSGGWKPVAQVDLRGAAQTTISFAAVTAQHFRIVFEPAPRSNENPFSGVPGAQVFDFGAAPPLKTITIKELRLESEPRVNRFELKAGFGVAPSYFALDLGLQDEPGVAIQDVIDLTSHMAPDGRLDWTPPPGRWRVLRLGYSLTGTTNHPTTKEASGLEVDKLDGPAVRRYLETYLSLYSDAAGGDRIGQHGVRALLTDSIEVGAANWTPKMLDDFQRLRGYDPRPWLPVLTGAVIGSRAQSDAFLYDYRRTLADLLASQHYGTVADVAHEHGLKLYGEALEDRRPMLGDDLTMRSHTDVPMSALWTYDPAKGPKPSYLGDMRGAASVAHIYGQNVVAAESLTAAFSPWAFAPHDLKKFIDLEFASGVNRPVIHTSVHQPLDDKQPGLSLFIFGQYFNRHETWAEMARPWIDYISRSAYLLQQGRNVADVAYFIGEERPITQLYEDHALGDLPRTHAFDFVDADIVLGKLSVDGQELVSPAGARYRALYLGGDSRRMTLPVLKKLAALAEAGGVIVGAAPTATPSLADDQKAFDDLVHQLWSGAPITAVGRGKIIASTDIEASLGQMGQRPDFRYDDPAGDRKVLFVHRRTPDADIYFVDNRKDRPEAFDAHFRIAGRTPEIWRAETGAAEPVSYRIEEAETRVPLEMRPYDAFFVVFRRPAHTAVRTIAKAAWRPALTLDRGWDVTFQPERGARAEAHFDKLASLSDNADPGVRYFSGVATYRTSFHADALRPGQRAQLDLGRIGDVGQVLVNGVAVGTAWNAPYRMDVTKALRPGENRLEVRIADLWVNRLIGDQQPGAKKITFTVAPTYKPDAPLRPSGLMGPVRLLTTR